MHDSCIQLYRHAFFPPVLLCELLCSGYIIYSSCYDSEGTGALFETCMYFWRQALTSVFLSVPHQTVDACSTLITDFK